MLLSTLVIWLAFVSRVATDSTGLALEREYLNWKMRYPGRLSTTILGGQLTTADPDHYRKVIYLANRDRILAHNADLEASYQMELNAMADLTAAEFQMMLDTVITEKATIEIVSPPTLTTYSATSHLARIEIDWTALNIVTPPKSQGLCGAGWAFAVIGSIESLLLQQTLISVDLAEQQILDCVATTEGCDGGWPEDAFIYAAASGLANATAYPYTRKQTSCSIEKGTSTFRGYTKSYGCSALLNHLRIRPVVVELDASNLQLYRTGTYSDCGHVVNHAALLVGYSDAQGWKLKNSWGTDWGENGYFHLLRGNTCGICYYPGIMPY